MKCIYILILIITYIVWINAAQHHMACETFAPGELLEDIDNVHCLGPRAIHVSHNII